MLKAVIFDWAGTTVDFGCEAPPAVLKRIFAEVGVPLEPIESRHAMGLLKKDQIRAICGLPRVSTAWREVHGAEPVERDVARLFQSFIPMQLECVEQYSDVIAGVPEVVARLRAKGIGIGSTTGYTRAMLDLVVAKAARQGYAPDCHLTPDETDGIGRPAPWMIFECLRRLNVYPPSHCVKVGDTPSDMEEGRNAGLKTIGVVKSGNEAAAHGEDEAARRLLHAGADILVATAADLEPALDTLFR